MDQGESAPNQPAPRQEDITPCLDSACQARLLQIARTAIERFLSAREIIKCADSDPALLEPAGAFVTLTQGGGVRACVGRLAAKTPLWATVRDMAIAAAVEDPRSEPLTEEDLPQIEIEISVLSPLRRVPGPDQIDVAKHGVLIELAGRSGVFLPQVARKSGWSRDVLLNELCEKKAGLPREAWRHGGRLYVFTVQEFHE
jgi:AmmeMemoRadiSam system protein A